MAIEKRNKTNSSYLNDSEIKSAKGGEAKEGNGEGPENKEEGENPDDAEPKEGAEPKEQVPEVDEELLRDMCLLSNSINQTNLRKTAEGLLERVANDPALKGNTKEVAETAAHEFGGDA